MKKKLTIEFDNKTLKFSTKQGDLKIDEVFGLLEMAKIHYKNIVDRRNVLNIVEEATKELGENFYPENFKEMLVKMNKVLDFQVKQIEQK